ncbi:mucin-19-like [Oryzias latipes]|uniref:mucin-19-like n=1 Tax=Oryzias latipes TaxID=8090 RepID=UPI000CE2322E|nr:mucin-19-like [Oryzias latipes]
MTGVHRRSNLRSSRLRATIESLLTSCITAWYAGCSAADRKALQRVINSAQEITDSPLPSLEDIASSRYTSIAKETIEDSHHPNHHLSQLLPSGRRCVVAARTSGNMTSRRRVLAVCLFFVSDTCKTFGSGVFQNFNGSAYYMRSSCRYYLTHFTHDNFECSIIVQRDKDSLLMSRVEIIINGLITVLEAKSITVKSESISLPYDQTYLQIFDYGVYKRLMSKLIPLTVTWNNVTGGIETLWVELEQELKPDTTGLCSSNGSQEKPTCPGELKFNETGSPFAPSCSNPNPSSSETVQTCVCRDGKVRNDRVNASQCVRRSDCPCVFAGKIYQPGTSRNTRCQSCSCNGGNWVCSANICPPKCTVEGQFVETFDGKPYTLPKRCRYVVSKGSNWTIKADFSASEIEVTKVVIELFEETYTFEDKKVKLKEKEITEFHKSDQALVFWQSSMFVLVQTSFDMKIQVQMSPIMQLYITLPGNNIETLSGLCGNGNNDTTDDFTSSNNIRESSSGPFALSWAYGLTGGSQCTTEDIPTVCVNSAAVLMFFAEIFAADRCAALINNKVFAECHSYISPEAYRADCIKTTCTCGSNKEDCVCTALGNYAKACTGLGIKLGDWRSSTNCTISCQTNQVFSYNNVICNSTCSSLSGNDPRCEVKDDPVEGCGCPEGTHLGDTNVCISKAECPCHYLGGTTPPGQKVIDGLLCNCENGELECSKDCG